MKTLYKDKFLCDMKKNYNMWWMSFICYHSPFVTTHCYNCIIVYTMCTGNF